MKDDDDSYIEHHKGGTTLVGPDAINLFRAVTLWSSIKMYIASDGRLIPTRGMTITRMLALATQYTGKKYKRTHQQQAVDDLKVWIDTMKAALPVKDDNHGR